jgi:hypothetical protein
MLTQSYQAFQIDVGLGGNIFGRSFGRLGHLATDGFFKNTWELLDYFGTHLRIHHSFDIPLLRENDRTVMDAIYDTGIFSSKELEQINRVRHHKKLSSDGDMLGCDGRSIMPGMYTQIVGESRWKFPHQQPTAADFKV